MFKVVWGEPRAYILDEETGKVKDVCMLRPSQVRSLLQTVLG